VPRLAALNDGKVTVEAINRKVRTEGTGSAPTVFNPSRAAILAAVEFKERRMGEFTENVKGATNEAIGKVKQGLGNLTDSERLKREGEAQEAKGEAQYVKGDIEGAVGNDI